MLLKMIYTLPELLLLTGVIHLCVLYAFKEDKSRTYAKVARLWLLASVFFSIIFYDKSFNEIYFSQNAWTLLCFLSASCFLYVVLGISPAWFAAEKRTGCKYYVLMLCSLVGIRLILTAVNLPILFLSYTLLICINWRLLSISYEKYSSEISFRYLYVSLVIIILFASGVIYLGKITSDNMGFTTLRNIFTQNTASLPLFIAAVSLVIPFLYSIGIVPFHILAEDKAGKSILPVGHYFAIVAPVAFFGAFIKINILVLDPYAEKLSKAYIVFALLSVIFGAVGANARINLNRVYAYCQMYCFGTILLLMSFFQKETFFIAYFLLFLSLVSINGLYLVLYSLRSHGEYLSSITSLSGLAETKPYTTGMLLISLFSLIGIPPLAGFVSQLEFAKVMISQNAQISLGIVLLFLLVLAKACLEIIKTAYFDQKIKIYDTESQFIVFCIFINAICIIAAVFNPFNYMEILKDMFYALYV